MFFTIYEHGGDLSLGHVTLFIYLYILILLSVYKDSAKSKQQLKKCNNGTRRQ